MRVYLGIDVGSVTIKLAVIDEKCRRVESLYLRTQGKPVQAIQLGLSRLRRSLSNRASIRGVGTTGSARYLAASLAGADVVKNEVTSQAIATLHLFPEAQTVIEIGGQDSKVILLEKGAIADFGMNTVCAAGTGSFLDHQAARLGISVQDIGAMALRSSHPTRITGRCTVFAESDLIQKQQMGHRIEDMVYGLCQALARNYMANVCLGKDIRQPVVFQGGVAFNQGMVKAFREILNTDNVIVPPHPEAMGAVGAALLAREQVKDTGLGTRFQGFSAADTEYRTSLFECHACPSACEIVQVHADGKIIARCGGRCDMWEGYAERNRS